MSGLGEDDTVLVFRIRAQCWCLGSGEEFDLVSEMEVDGARA